MMDFKSKVVVITGGAGGLGLALAHQLDALGSNIALLDKTIIGLEAKTNSFNRVPLILEIDITDEAACKRAIDQVKDHFGRIDLLINNAGITHIEALNEHHGQIIKKVMDVNFFGSVNCTMAALSSLKASQGHIVTLSSVAGFAPLFGRTAYSASKYALHGFFETLRTELTTYDVNVTMVCPSFIDTGIRSSNPDSIHQEKTTVGESVTPDQAAKILIKGIAQKKRLILIGRTAKLSYWVKKLMPRYYDKKMLEGLGKG